MPEGHAAQDIHQAARRVRDRIHRDGSAAVRSFAEFAEQFALDPKLRDEAVLAGLEISAMAESGQPAPARHLLDLLERIVDDYVRHGGQSALMDRARAQAQARASLEREATAGLAAMVARGIGKTYAKSGFTLGSLSLELRLGQITGVVGQNAHGKTTLLRIVAGELRHDAGALTYPLSGDMAARVDWVKVKSSLAYVPQELPPWRGSLADSLHFEASIRGIHGAQNEREVKFIVERLGLAEHLGKTWREL
ncbi:MAG: ATP-binding cassette domain-containing protein, partial [Rhodocyclaceae bacterium]|nr:ATP-binding cassette domain-containing protein [Rhodocyclaceae bacterium]